MTTIEANWCVPVTTISGRDTVRCHLAWAPERPCEVALNIAPTNGASPVPWIVSRDLLAGGLLIESGEADVVVKPVSPTEIALILTSPHGRASLLLPRLHLEEFITDTNSAIPVGAEDLTIPDYIPDDWYTAGTA